MIRSIRKLLRSILGEQLVEEEVLQTTMTEVERILNRRPLVPNPDSPDKFGSLCPEQLLNSSGERSFGFRETQTPERLSRRWRQVQHLADLFWNKWIKLYLPQMQQRQKWHTARRGLRIGDLVLVSDVRTSRGLWPKGVVERTVAGKDGLIREVFVRTNAGILRRDIRQLCLLEATLDEEKPVPHCGGSVSAICA